MRLQRAAAWLASCATLGVASPSSAVRELAATGEIDASAPGVRLLHDYGAFGLYEVPASGPRSVPDTLLFDNHPIDTRTFQPGELPQRFRVTPSPGPALQLIQFVGPIKPGWLAAVEGCGARLVHYVANNGYMVWADASARTCIDGLVSAGDFLRFSAPHQPYLKLERRAMGRVASGTQDVVPVVIQLYRHSGLDATRAFIAERTLRVLAPAERVLRYENLQFEVPANAIAEIAARSDVVFVGERPEPELHDEVQGQIIAGSFDGAMMGPSGPGYLAFLTNLGFPTTPTSYPIVDVVDGGIGNGTVDSGDRTLHQLGNIANPTRLAFVANCTDSADGRGEDGHGHINVSIAGGYDTLAGFPNRDPAGFQRGLGSNPFGRFAGTRIFDPSFDLSGCGGTSTGLIRDIWKDGARIATSSWGCPGCAETYDTMSQAWDAGVRDADASTAGNQELIVLFSAGNDGDGPGTVNSPGNGKNMITVGASENDRPADEGGSWTDGCGDGPTEADNAMDVIGFSSRGPAPGGRAKPDVVAPGTHVQGTASTSTVYTGSGVCDRFRPPGQTLFAASSGTSHSTPAVAGVASLYHNWLERSYGITPSPALMKAYLVGHPTYLTGVGANDTLPSNSQGYGMPNLIDGLDASTRRFLLDQSTILGSSGEIWTFHGSVHDASRPLRVVLAYTDAPGAVGTSPQVNNLDLRVEVAGVPYRGNVFSGQWSATGGNADAANNTEAVFLPPGTSGEIRVTVTALNIAGDGVPATGDGTDQDFALACSNCNRAPECGGAVASASVLWPPNHRFQSVSVAGVTDPDGDPVAITITSIEQDEPTQTVGDVNTCPDGAGTGTGVAHLRSERSGTRTAPGDGRVYRVGFTAEDGSGGRCEGVVSVCAPNDRAVSPTCVDQGPVYSSTVCSSGFPVREPCTGSDGDGDGVCDAEDRCLAVADPSQGDADADGIGDACDGDFTNDGIVGGPDYVRLLATYGAREGDPRFDYGLDLDGDGVIGVIEYLRLGQGFARPPGPSGLDCAGLVPCP